MTDYISKTGTTLFNKAKFKPSDRQRLRVATCTHNAAATALPASNVINIVTVPASTIVIGATVDVHTVQANTNLSVGMGANADYWMADTPLDTAGTVVPDTIGTCVTPYQCNAAANITIAALTNAINAAVFTVSVVYIEMDAQTAAN